MPTLQGGGGIDLGGAGKFEFVPELCRLEVVQGGLLEIAEVVRKFFSFWYSIGLFQNDYTPKLADDLSYIVPADFSGYDGLRLFGQFSTPVMSGVKARSIAPRVVWAHDGGPINNIIYGYYVVRNDGTLAWAERFCAGPITVDRKGRKVNIIPVFSWKNWREEDS